MNLEDIRVGYKVTPAHREDLPDPTIFDSNWYLEWYGRSMTVRKLAPQTVVVEENSYGWRAEWLQLCGRRCSCDSIYLANNGCKCGAMLTERSQNR